MFDHCLPTTLSHVEPVAAAPAQPAPAQHASEPTGQLWTTRHYPCGCSAAGQGDIPAYCPEHVPAQPAPAEDDDALIARLQRCYKPGPKDDTRVEPMNLLAMIHEAAARLAALREERDTWDAAHTRQADESQRLRSALAEAQRVMSDAAISISVVKGNLGEHTEGRHVLDGAERRLLDAARGRG